MPKASIPFYLLRAFLGELYRLDRSIIVGGGYGSIVSTEGKKKG